MVNEEFSRIMATYRVFPVVRDDFVKLHFGCFYRLYDFCGSTEIIDMKQRLWVLWTSSEEARATCPNFDVSLLTYKKV
jgi:hypothetical protein